MTYETHNNMNLLLHILFSVLKMLKRVLITVLSVL